MDWSNFYISVLFATAIYFGMPLLFHMWIVTIYKAINTSKIEYLKMLSNMQKEEKEDHGKKEKG